MFLCVLWWWKAQQCPRFSLKKAVKPVLTSPGRGRMGSSVYSDPQSRAHYFQMLPRTEQSRSIKPLKHRAVGTARGRRCECERDSPSQNTALELTHSREKSQAVWQPHVPGHNYYTRGSIMAPYACLSWNRNSFIFLLPPLLQVGISKRVEQICGARELFLYLCFWFRQTKQSKKAKHPLPH